MATMTDVTAAIHAANQLFETRVRAHDTAGIAALYTDDAILMPPNADFMQGPRAISAFFKSAIDGMGVSQLKLKTIDVETLGDTAIEVGSYAMYAAEQLLDEGKYLVVWKQRPGGDWRLHRDIFNSSRPPAAA